VVGAAEGFFAPPPKSLGILINRIFRGYAALNAFKDRVEVRHRILAVSAIGIELAQRRTKRVRLSADLRGHVRPARSTTSAHVGKDLIPFRRALSRVPVRSLLYLIRLKQVTACLLRCCGCAG